MAETPSTRKRWVRRLLISTAVFAVLFVAASWHFACHLTGPRHRTIGPPPSDYSFTVEDVSWTTADAHTIEGWFIPGTDSERAIVLLHGFAGDRRSMLPRAKAFRAAGYAVLAYECAPAGKAAARW